MITDHFKTGFRSLVKRKGYTLLNVLSLAIGMTCCLLIFHYVSYERSYDDNAGKNIYRLRLDSYQHKQLAWRSATVYPGIPKAMKSDFPEVEDYCRLIDAEMLVSNEKNATKFNETKGYYASQSFIPMFDLSFVSGNPAMALTGPDKIIVSEKMAKKYFGSEPAQGKRLTLKNDGTSKYYEISGVFKDHPRNSHLIIDYLISYESFKKRLREQGRSEMDPEGSMGWYDFYCYLKLKPGTDVKKLEAKFPAFCKRHLDWEKNGEYREEISILPVQDIHLYSNYNQEAEVNGSGQMVAFLFLIAIFIICIAWINYINLSTARSVERAKEVGMKKVLGASRTELVKQFLVENFILNALSVCIALIVFFFLLPAFDLFSGRDVFTGIALSGSYWWLFSVLFIGGTLLSGLYPAFILSGFEPAKVLKGAFKNTSGGLALRRGLIVFQFVITVVLIAGTMIVYQQVHYMRKQALGANIAQTLVLAGPSSIKDSAYHGIEQPFKTDLLRLPGVTGVSASSNVMGQEIYWTNGAGRIGENSGYTMYFIGVDNHFISDYAMKLRSGRNFSKDFGTDKKAVILNEKAARLVGFANAKAAVGQKLMHGNDTGIVIGVVADYHHQGLQKAIEPMIFLPVDNIRSYYSLKISGDPSKIIAAAEKTWNSYFPNDPFSYFFLDDTFDQQYKTDILFGKVFGVFALIAIIIACSGLLGLSAYNVLQRHKEIGIRKVLGASSENIILLLSKDFVRLILISFVIAIPAGWYIMHYWLRDFAYHIELRWWVFAISACIAFLIAASTIILQALKAVTANPVKSLRTE